MAEPTKILSGLHFIVLDKDIVDDNGNVLYSKGEEVALVPQTLAKVVECGENGSLDKVILSLQTLHVKLMTEVVRLSSLLTQLGYKSKFSNVE